jgi:hypothetical protein
MVSAKVRLPIGSAAPLTVTASARPWITNLDFHSLFEGQHEHRLPAIEAQPIRYAPDAPWLCY